VITGGHEPVLIDLDLVRPEPQPGPAASGRSGRWLRSRRLAAVAVAVAAVVAFSVTGEAPAGLGAGISTPLTVQATGMPKLVIGDTLYTVGPATGAGAGESLNAYSLRTGRLRWRTDLPDLGTSYLVDAGRYLLVAYPQTREAVALDVRTGAVRWRRPGSPLWSAPAGDRIALMTPRYSADGQSTSEVRMIMMATAQEAVVVSQPTDGRELSPVFAGDTAVRAITGVFVRQDDGGGQLFDFASGRERRLDLPKPPLPAFGSESWYEIVMTVGGLLLQFGGSDRQNVLTAYAGEQPRQRWSISGVGIERAWMCGGSLCLADPNQSAVLDPATGEARWQPRWAMLWRGTGSRLLASDQSGQDDGRGIGVVDQATGRELRRQSLWRPIARIEGARLPVLAYSPGGQILAVLDVTRLTTYRLARLGKLVDRCWASDVYVVCLAGPGTVRAWRYSS
jgi:outer membrane protein assembly factor BamB